MTAKLRVELENATKKGFDEIVKDLERLGVEARDTEKALGKLNQELGSPKASEMAKHTKELAAELGGIAAATRKAADSHRDLQQEMDERKARAYKDQISKISDEMTGLGKKTEKAGDANKAFWTETISKVMLFKDALPFVTGGVRSASAFSVKMAEDGQSAFAKLNASVDKFGICLEEIGDSDVLANTVEDLALTIDDLAPAMDGASDAMWSFLELGQDGVIGLTGYVISLGESLGLLSEGFSESFKEAGQGRDIAQQRRAEERARERQERDERKAALKAEREQDLLNPGAKMRAEQVRADRLDAIKGAAGEIQIQNEINALLAKQAALIAEIKAKDLDPTTNRQVLDNAKELTALESRRAQLIKERQDKQKEKEKELRDARAAAEKKEFDAELKFIDTLLRESTQSADKIRELEKRRFDLVKENKERERKLAIEAGTLEQKLFEEDMARIEARKKKEREAALAGIENERKLYLAREHRRDLERQAEQEKVDKFKEFLQGSSGGDSLSFGGNSGNTQFTFAPTFAGGGGHECCCPCPGGGMGGGAHPMPTAPSMPTMPQMPMGGYYPPMMPPMWQGPNIPMPQGWHGQIPWPGGGPKPRPNPIGLLTGGITPKNVWDQTVKNAQDDEEKKRIAEGQASGKLDQNGNPIDYKKEEEREKTKYVRNQIAQGFKALGIDIGPQQNLGDEQKPREGWKESAPSRDMIWDPKGKFWTTTDSPRGQELIKEDQEARNKKQKEAAEARKLAEADPYRKIEELRKQEEEQQRKKDVAEQTRKQGETDKAENLPDLKKKEEDESKKLADIQKQKADELKKVKEFEDKRRQESSDRTAKAKEADKKFREDYEKKNATERRVQDENDVWILQGRAENPFNKDPTNAERRQKALDKKTQQQREQERKFSPQTDSENPKQRADARKLAQARGRAAIKMTKAQTKTKTLQRGKRGQITGVETTRAYHDVVQQQVDQLKSQGRLDQTQTQAIEQLTQGFRDSAMSNAEMQAKLDQLLEVIYEIRGARPSKGRRQAGR